MAGKTRSAPNFRSLFDLTFQSLKEIAEMEAAKAVMEKEESFPNLVTVKEQLHHKRERALTKAEAVIKFASSIKKVKKVANLLALIAGRFGNLRWLELPMELITVPVIHEVANRCPKLTHLTLDFSTGVQLCDFDNLSSFPPRLTYLAICLSNVIFLEGFLRKIYNFIGSVEVLHIIGTHENIEQDEEVYEVINTNKLRSHIPRLRTLNLFGVTFLTDEHIEAITLSLGHLEVLSVSYSQNITGCCFKNLIRRCKKLACLLASHCWLSSTETSKAEWELSVIEELDISGTDLSTDAILSILQKLPRLTWFGAGFLENFSNKVLIEWMQNRYCPRIRAIDLDSSSSVTAEILMDFLKTYGTQLHGLNLGGMPKLLDDFWLEAMCSLKELRVLILGIANRCCAKVSVRVHIDPLLSMLCEKCPRLERLEVCLTNVVRFDPSNLRFSETISAKSIDLLRHRCTKLKSLALCDGSYYEMVYSNFQRAQRHSIVRTTDCYQTTLVQLLQHFIELRFN